MSEIRNWVESTGLGQYREAFEVNDIDMELLKQVDDQTPKDIGIASAGHRLRLQNAIAKLATASVAEANLSDHCRVRGAPADCDTPVLQDAKALPDQWA
jgi:hypothetical protein